MSPVAEINQQPQPAQMEMTTQPSNGVVAQQPGQVQSMTADPEVSMRGGGVGDCLAALCAFECCKDCCECCC